MLGGCRTVSLPSWAPFTKPAPPAAPAPVAEPRPPPEAPVTEVPSEPPAPELPYAREDLAKLRAQAREVLRKQADAYWKAWTLGKEPELSGLLTDKAGLFTGASVDLLRKASIGAPPDHARAFDHFALYLAGEIIANEAGPAEDRIAGAQASATVRLGESETPWRGLEERIAAEPNAAARSQLAAAEQPLMEKLAPLVRERNASIESSAKRLGWASAADYAAALAEMPLDQAAELARRTLEATDRPYRRIMERLSTSQNSLPLAKLRRSDVARLLAFGRSDRFFPAAQAVPTAQGVFRGLGLALTSQRGLTLHSAPSTAKNPRPVCFPIDVPGDVRVSVRPAAGAAVVRELVHELVHAEAYLHDKRPEWEFKLLGGAVTSEAFATAVAGVIDQPAWLQEVAKVDADTAAAHARYALARRLLAVRLAAARVILETALRTGTEPDPAERWRKAASRAFGFELTTTDAQRWVLEDSGLASSIDELRGALLAAQIERALATRSNGAWWRSDASGALLVKAWAEGSRATPDEVARLFGDDTIGPAALVQLADERLSMP